MNLLRGLLFDNLGLKLVALLLAVLVYLNVFTERPATLMVSFPIRITDLADSLSLSGPTPAAIQVELRGTGKHLIRLQVTQPPMNVSLAGVGIGRYERALGPEDLPLPEGVELGVDRMVSPRTLELQVDRRIERELPVAVSVEGKPSSGVLWDGSFEIRPSKVTVSGPESVLNGLDTVHVSAVSLAGRHDTLRVAVQAVGLPPWCELKSGRVEVFVPLEQGVTRRFPVAVGTPAGGARFRVTPARVTAIVTAPRRLAADAGSHVEASWWAPTPYSRQVGRRVVVHSAGDPTPGLEVRFEPDSVLLQAATP
jgi:YbbR domain-containing protein